MTGDAYLLSLWRVLAFSKRTGGSTPGPSPRRPAPSSRERSAERFGSSDGSGAKIIWLYKILRKSNHQSHYRSWPKFYLHQNRLDFSHCASADKAQAKSTMVVAITIKLGFNRI